MKKRMNDEEFALRDRLRMLRSEKKRVIYQLENLNSALKAINKVIAEIKIKLAKFKEKPPEKPKRAKKSIDPEIMAAIDNKTSVIKKSMKSRSI